MIKLLTKLCMFYCSNFLKYSRMEHVLGIFILQILIFGLVGFLVYLRLKGTSIPICSIKFLYL